MPIPVGEVPRYVHASGGETRKLSALALLARDGCASGGEMRMFAVFTLLTGDTCLMLLFVQDLSTEMAARFVVDAVSGSEEAEDTIEAAAAGMDLVGIDLKRAPTAQRTSSDAR